jgi:hypothetical protein
VHLLSLAVEAEMIADRSDLELVLENSRVPMNHWMVLELAKLVHY